MDASYILDENKYKICYIVNEQDLLNEASIENPDNPENPENPNNTGTPLTNNTQANTNTNAQDNSKADTPQNDLAIELEEEHDLKHLYKFTPKKYEVKIIFN